MTSRVLQVFLLGQAVGELVQAHGKLSFSYLPQWLESGHARPLSHSLPLQAAPFDDLAARPFFSGLLPEGTNRQLAAQVLQVSQENDFALLDGLGGECAGAVTLLGAAGPAVGSGGQQQIQWLSDTELLTVLDELPRRPMLAGQEGLRLSLAGVQDKLPVVVREGRIGLPLDGTPSTHILKPAIDSVEGSVFNEAFCLTLAKRIGLQAVNVTIRQIEERSVLLVERYDRESLSTGSVQRLHQEDFCQALGIVPEYKYQNEGGPDLVQCFALVRATTRPNAPQVLRLLDYVIFNALIGNHDAHGKNFSLLYAAKSVVLAPLYDALSTAVYTNLSDKMAMKIGSKYKFAELQTRHWDQFAQAAGLSTAQAKKRLLEITRLLPTHARSLLNEFSEAGTVHPILVQIVELVGRRCELVARRLNDAALG
jgi:serine/threonine-protein kinase HipA